MNTQQDYLIIKSFMANLKKFKVITQRQYGSLERKIITEYTKIKYKDIDHSTGNFTISFP